MTLNVVCVLRSGGIYTPEWVAKLQPRVAANLSQPHRFICLSDVDVPCERFRLLDGWPGWWSKIEMFAPGLFKGPVLYLDLDSIIVGPLDELVTERGFRAVKMWGQRKGGICSTAMAWHGDFSEIYRRFKADPEGTMVYYDKTLPGGRVGDQAMIEDVLADMGKPIDHFPESAVVSFKDHARQGPPKGASVVALHGRPKPNEARAGWAHEMWRATGWP